MLYLSSLYGLYILFRFIFKKEKINAKRCLTCPYIYILSLLFMLADRAKDAGTELPKFFLWCGTEDALVEVGRAFRDKLESVGADVCYSESEGNHSFKYWDMHIERALKYYFGK